MLAPFGVVLAGLLVVGVFRRGGVALWLGLLVGGLLLGDNDIDPTGAGIAAVAVFGVVRFAQLYNQTR